MSLDSNTIEQLTAYLDGELEPAEVLQVEQRLSTDHRYRAEMQKLQQTWELLDRLPTTEASSMFTRSTMELVVKDAVKEVERSHRKWWIWPMRLATLILLPLALFSLTYGLVLYNLGQPTRQLVEDLQVIENFDAYQTVDRKLDYEASVRFLKGLAISGQFSEDDAIYTNAGLSPEVFQNESVPEPVLVAESAEQKRARIEAMDAEQREALVRKFVKFQQLEPDRQESFRQFHQQLMKHPEHAQLVRTMRRYYNWIKTTLKSADERARLLDLRPDQRLVEIQNIMARQQREEFGRSGATALPTHRDAEWLFDWFDLTISSKESVIRQNFPAVVNRYMQTEGKPEIETFRLEQFASSRPLKTLLAFLFRTDRQWIQDLILEDVDLLRPNLSFEAQAILDDQSPGDQRELILNWIISANLAKSSVSEQQLQIFYEQVLTQQERDELYKLDPASWKTELRKKYQQHYRNDNRREDQDEADSQWELLLQQTGFESN